MVFAGAVVPGGNVEDIVGVDLDAKLVVLAGGDALLLRGGDGWVPL